MTTIQLIACVGMIAGLFMVLGISPAEMSDSIFSRLTAPPAASGRTSMRRPTQKGRFLFAGRINRSPGGIGRIRAGGKIPHGVHGISGAVCPGACIAILAGNAFLVPVLAVGFMLMPFWYVKLTAGGFKRMWPPSWKRRCPARPAPAQRC